MSDDGTIGEREMQARMGSQHRARNFYDRQMKDRLSNKMSELIRRQEMVFVATSDAAGNCDCSPRFGQEGFVLIIDDKTLVYPEYRGNGVFAGLGNILENPHIGLVFVDFYDTTLGLHVNGSARCYFEKELPDSVISRIDSNQLNPDIIIRQWVVITIDEAYIHCSKHVPLLGKKDKTIKWGTDDPVAKSTDFSQVPYDSSDGDLANKSQK